MLLFTLFAGRSLTLRHLHRRYMHTLFIYRRGSRLFGGEVVSEGSSSLPRHFLWGKAFCSRLRGGTDPVSLCNARPSPTRDWHHFSFAMFSGNLKHKASGWTFDRPPQRRFAAWYINFEYDCSLRDIKDDRTMPCYSGKTDTDPLQLEQKNGTEDVHILT